MISTYGGDSSFPGPDALRQVHDKDLAVADSSTRNGLATKS